MYTSLMLIRVVLLALVQRNQGNPEIRLAILLNTVRSTKEITISSAVAIKYTFL